MQLMTCQNNVGSCSELGLNLDGVYVTCYLISRHICLTCNSQIYSFKQMRGSISTEEYMCRGSAL